VPESNDVRFIERAVELALAAERDGNLPIGAVITLDDDVVGEGSNRIVSPRYHPGRHAEIEALGSVPLEAWHRASAMTCYSTLEPCVMCTGALLLHGVGRVVFGASDTGGGGGAILPHLPPFFEDGAGVPEWVGPVSPERCDPLFARARALFAELPCGQRLPRRTR
jgi:tRNA(adenine34) deaminase